MPFPFNDRQIQDALELQGGSVFNLSPGQVTDDTEMTIQLMQALQNYFMGNNNRQQKNRLYCNRISNMV